MSDPYKHTIRAFLVHVHANIMRHSSERFSFRSGSVGNFFFAGARIFFRWVPMRFSFRSGSAGNFFAEVRTFFGWV